jgi:hypothetical protein
MPEPVSAALIAAVSTGIVHAMAGDAWHATAHRLAKALGRGHARESELLAQLNEDRRTVRSAAGADRDAVSAAARARWSGVLRNLAQSDPDAPATFKELAAILEQTGGQSVVDQRSNRGSNQNINVSGRGNNVAGRDNNKTIKTGGVLIAIVAVVAIIWGGSKIYDVASNAVSGPSITPNSTCSQWLRADENTQRQSALAAAEEDGNQAEMSDGFIVQNVQYDCGYNPNSTLLEILKVRSQ